jgi:hypothetical protein
MVIRELRFQLSCCGVNSFEDWKPYLEKLNGYPASCEPGKDQFAPPHFTRGCLSVLVKAINAQLAVMASVAIGIAIIQVRMQWIDCFELWI